MTSDIATTWDGYLAARESRARATVREAARQGHPDTAAAAAAANRDRVARDVAHFAGPPGAEAAFVALMLGRLEAEVGSVDALLKAGQVPAGRRAALARRVFLAWLAVRRLTHPSRWQFITWLIALRAAEAALDDAPPTTAAREPDSSPLANAPPQVGPARLAD